MRAPALAAAALAIAVLLPAPASAVPSATGPAAPGTGVRAAAPVTVTAGHVDVLDVNYAAGALTLGVLDGSGGAEVERAPADVVFGVPAAAKVTVPAGSAWSFLGTPGATAWVLPQSQNPALLFAGWNTFGVPADAVRPGSLTVRLTSVSGPGRFSVYTTGTFGTPARLFDSGDGLPDARTVAAATHAHANWAFSAAGSYTATFEATATLTGGATVTTGPQPFTFTVTG